MGLQTTEACGDCPRGIHGSPLAGDSLDEVLDPSSAIDEIVRSSLGNPEYANLPRKYKTAVPGCRTSRTRRMTSRSSASSTRARSRPDRAAACRPTRCWPSGSASGCR
ncbi:hypothetical protein MTIM_52640 [Mycobacterium timonense]|uniref:Nitrite/sulphite reductase 4Fe-4S domain-containing protein n=1 Tax=Mycobacterium timonense TaxID=701043 RepID=A0A7I9ZEV5_9MYCO|nr:hypothetical protein MTIM_52640 [Mycobacterium timonense]